MAIYAVIMFLAGRRVLYAAPTTEQIDSFWWAVKRALLEPIEAGYLHKNETEHYVMVPNTKQRIKAKTAWNADTLRGDFADVLILDEWQLMNEEAWGRVGAPMLLDNDGDAVFIYTPPSLQSRSTTKASDPQHAAKMFKRAALDETGRWATFHFQSSENPHISQAALDEIANDMTALAYRQEILAEDIDEAPGALWTRKTLEDGRLTLDEAPQRDVVVVAIDPSGTSGGDATGIITSYRNKDRLYIIEDNTLQGSPITWATAAIDAYHRHDADVIVAEANFGGEMVALTLATVDPTVPVRLVHASRGKAVRAAPISAIFEQGRGHLVGNFPMLEDELCMWTPGDPSPNRLDALVWGGTRLMLKKKVKNIPQVKSYSFGI